MIPKHSPLGKPNTYTHTHTKTTEANQTTWSKVLPEPMPGGSKVPPDTVYASAGHFCVVGRKAPLKMGKVPPETSPRIPAEFCSPDLLPEAKFRRKSP